MIHVFFNPGMFGSTVEYVLRNFTEELESIDAEIRPDGSMHSFVKENHMTGVDSLNQIVNQSINTPIYPFKDLALPEILATYPNNPNDKYVLIYADNTKSAELNMLFKYYKIVVGLNRGFVGFYGDTESVKKWNPNYTSYNDMQTWEFREWLSLFFPHWIMSWQNSANQVPTDWLKISTSNLLFDTANTFKKIIHYCELTESPGVDNFAVKWRNAQEYIVNEYNLLEKIVESTLNQQKLQWDSLNVISEAIIQHRLRSNGFEIKCNGLNTLPTDSISLYNLLDSNIKLH